MGRIRTIKPEFFLNEDLYDLEEETGLPVRLAYSGLWCQCDREGRFKWQPRKLKVTILPYDDIDFSRVLHALTTRGFVQKYEVNGEVFGWVPGFLQHQVINNREKDSDLPDPSSGAALTREPRDDDASSTREVRVPIGREGKGREQESRTKRKRFIPPTEDEVSARCFEMGYTVCPTRFWNYYESVGWKVGKNPMKDWHKALAGWQARDNDGKGKGSTRDSDIRDDLTDTSWALQ